MDIDSTGPNNQQLPSASSSPSTSSTVFGYKQLYSFFFEKKIVQVVF